MSKPRLEIEPKELKDFILEGASDKEEYTFYILHHIALSLTRLSVTHACLLSEIQKMVEIQQEYAEEDEEV